MEINNNISIASSESRNIAMSIDNSPKFNLESQGKIQSGDSLDSKDSKGFKEGDKKSVNKKELDKLFSEVNQKFTDKQFSYDIHEKTNRVIVKIKDSSNGKLLKEIPTEESLDLSAKILEMSGLLIDKKS